MADEYGVTALTDLADIAEIEAAYNAKILAGEIPPTGVAQVSPTGVVSWEVPAKSVQASSPEYPPSTGVAPLLTPVSTAAAPSFQNIFILVIVGLVIYTLVSNA